MAVQGHTRSLILASSESTCVTSCWSSIVTSVLSCAVSEILHVFLLNMAPHLYSTLSLGVFPLDQIADVDAPKSEDPSLITRVISFKLSQPI